MKTSKNNENTPPENRTLNLTGKKCLIYARTSTADQENSNQVAQLQEYAHKQGWTVIITLM
ncbi:MAG: hypothetical protein A2283_15265 [Lentisphaerae bacterium RIFOXYA12_FULL_48_11]|nr:MAG: hypothetical protein A2283_15265 [Lentisphaerae bacterium RIFOXYA12_FULL_48_11]